MATEQKKLVFEETNTDFTLKAFETSDHLKLFIDLELKAGQGPSSSQIFALLEKHVKGNFIDSSVLDDIAKNLKLGKNCKDRRVAKGLAAQIGQDGKLLILVKIFNGKIEVNPDDKTPKSLNDLHLFDNLTKGQVVGRVYPPKPGIDGKGVLGQVLSGAIGKPIKATFDKSLSLGALIPDQNYQPIIAEQEGFLCAEGEKLKISNEILVKGDLDYRFGNIDFIGQVKVSGDVMPGFNIRAKTGIEINGSVRGGSLASLQGPISVKEFVFGGESSRIISGQSFTAKMVQEVNADIKGNIVILKEARDSTLRACGTLSLVSGQLIGGDAYAVCGVEAKFIGSEGEKSTTIHLCSDVESTLEYAELLAKITAHEKAAELIKLHLGPLASNPSRIQLLKQPHRDKMQLLFKKFKQIEDSKINLLAEKLKLLESAHVNNILRVNVLGMIYPGVKIMAEDQVHTITEKLKGPISIDYIKEEKKFVVAALKPLECSIHEKKADKKETHKTEEKKDGQKK